MNQESDVKKSGFEFNPSKIVSQDLSLLKNADPGGNKYQPQKILHPINI